MLFSTTADLSVLVFLDATIFPPAFAILSTADCEKYSIPSNVAALSRSPFPNTLTASVSDLTCPFCLRISLLTVFVIFSSLFNAHRFTTATASTNLKCLLKPLRFGILIKMEVCPHSNPARTPPQLLAFCHL